MSDLPVAQPLQLAVDVGSCRWNQRGEGTWWNDVGGPYFDALNMRSSCWQISARRVDRFGWRAAIVDLGVSRVVESAWGGAAPASPHWEAYGTASVQGASVGGVLEQRWGSWRLSGEAGGFIYRSQLEAVAVHYSHNSSQQLPMKATVAVSPYWRGEAGYSWSEWSVGFALQSFSRVRFNNEALGDHVGPESAHIIQQSLTIRLDF